jgi:membrane protease YdiL (CAAX protease family)
MALRAGAELLIVFGLLESYLWGLRAMRQPAIDAAVFAAIAVAVGSSYWRRRALPREEPAPGAGRGRAWTECLAATVVAGLAILVLSWALSDPYEHFRLRFLEGLRSDRAAGRAVIATLTIVSQQVLLQLFVWPACREVVRVPIVGAVLAAALFGFAHLPSLPLAALTMAGGLMWIALYARSRRIVPLFVSHAVLVCLAYGALPARLTFDLRVGVSAAEEQDVYRILSRPDTREFLTRASSPDYLASAGGTAVGVVGALHRDVLGRAPTAEEQARWTAWLARRSPVELARRLVRSDEFRRAARGHDGGRLLPQRQRQGQAPRPSTGNRLTTLHGGPYTRPYIQ